MKTFLKWLAGSISAWATYFGVTYTMILMDLPEVAITAFVLPFMLFAVTFTFLNPGKRLFRMYCPEGKVKRLLLREFN